MPRPRTRSSTRTTRAAPAAGSSEPLRSAFADDPEMAELIADFLQEIPGRLEAIEEAIGQGDHERVAAIAHQLKGAGGGYGFPPISDAAAALERAARAEADHERVRANASALIEVCRRAAA